MFLCCDDNLIVLERKLKARKEQELEVRTVSKKRSVVVAKQQYAVSA